MLEHFGGIGAQNPRIFYTPPPKNNNIKSQNDCLDGFPLQTGGFQDHVYFWHIHIGPWILQPAGQPWFFKDGYTTNGPRQHTGCKTAELCVAEWGADRFVCRRRRLGENGCGNQFLNHRVFEWYMLKLSIWAETCWNHMNTWCTPWFRGATFHSFQGTSAMPPVTKAKALWRVGTTESTRRESGLYECDAWLAGEDGMWAYNIDS